MIGITEEQASKINFLRRMQVYQCLFNLEEASSSYRERKTLYSVGIHDNKIIYPGWRTFLYLLQSLHLFELAVIRSKSKTILFDIQPETIEVVRLCVLQIFLVAVEGIQ